MFTYAVKGSWPFPTDMLRRDDARAATPADQALIDRLSGSYMDDRGLVEPVVVTLVIPNATRHTRPNHDRWRSFAWEVVGDRQDEADKAAQAAAAKRKADYASGVAKLTPDELAAIRWFGSGDRSPMAARAPGTLAARYRITPEVHNFNRKIDPFEVDGGEVCERVVALLRQIGADTRLDTQVGFWRRALPGDLRKHGFCEIVVGDSYTITVHPIEDPS